MRRSDYLKMTQDEINDAEWNNPDNWNMFLYSSEHDTRLFVPHGNKLSLNFGHATAWWIAIGHFAFVFVFVVFVFVMYAWQ